MDYHSPGAPPQLGAEYKIGCTLKILWHSAPNFKSMSTPMYQNFSILDFTGTKNDVGDGDKWSFKTCNQTINLIKLSPSPALTGQMPFLSPNQHSIVTSHPCSRRKITNYLIYLVNIQTCHQ